MENTTKEKLLRMLRLSINLDEDNLYEWGYVKDPDHMVDESYVPYEEWFDGVTKLIDRLEEVV